jgi:prophage antirepressor-like protein
MEKNEFEQLSELLRVSMDRITAKQAKKFAEALAAIAPEIVNTLRDLATSDASTVAERIECVKLLLRLYRKTLDKSLDHDLAAKAHIAIIEKSRAAKAASRASEARAKAEKQNNDLKIANERRRMARALNAARRDRQAV